MPSAKHEKVSREDFERLMTVARKGMATAAQRERMRAIEEAAVSFALVIAEQAPECADRAEAIRAVRMAKMWANCAVILYWTE